MIPSALRQSLSPSKFSDLNHIMTLQNFDPSNPPNNHLYSNNNIDDEYIDYVNDDVNRFYRKHNGPSMQFIGNATPTLRLIKLILILISIKGMIASIPLMLRKS